MSITFQDIAVMILIYGIVTLGLDLVVGYARVFSINQALLFGIGAFSFAFTVQHVGPGENLLVAWAIAIPVAAVVSAIVALASLRIVGDYFIVASFATQLVGLQVLYNWTSVSGGANGVFNLPYPTIFGWTPTTILDYLWLTLVVAACCYGAVSFLLLAPYGRVIRALGENEQALAAAGFSVLRLKVGTFVLGGALAACAGVLFAGYIGVAQVADFSLSISITLLAMVIVGGAGRVVGGLLGAAMLVLIPKGLDLSNLQSSVSGPLKQLIFGGMLVVIVMFMTSGLTGIPSQLARLRWRRGEEGERPEAPA
jgi:ABC-type branched-subunit amino acid transport system permease subunit